jgi:predicted O-methyltransferase YrrM
MKRYQTFHEVLIPLLVEGIGAESYLEFGTHRDETIGNVRCERRIGVDIAARFLEIGAGIRRFAMSTQEFIQDHAADLAPYDFVFIDADHSAEAVAKDFHGIWPYVSEDGLVCFHDSNPELESDTAPGFCGDSWKFAKELTRDKRYECVTLPYHPGLTIVRKRSQWGPG